MYQFSTKNLVLFIENKLIKNLKKSIDQELRKYARFHLKKKKKERRLKFIRPFPKYFRCQLERTLLRETAFKARALCVITISTSVC